MKVYLSADMEGVASCTAKQETDPADSREYPAMARRMTQEVRAACLGALAAGATEVVVKDAHWTGRNIDPAQLPEKSVTLIRGWSGHPYSMMQELDRSFAAVVYVGYHARAGSGGNPLAHTMSSGTFAEIRINGVPTSEFYLNTLTAAREGVPAVFLSGDRALCAEAREQVPGLTTVETFTGVGASTVGMHPADALARIQAGVERAVRARATKPLALPAKFEVEVDYKKPEVAYRASFYPGARLAKDGTVAFGCTEYLDVLKLIHFAR